MCEIVVAAPRRVMLTNHPPFSIPARAGVSFDSKAAKANAPTVFSNKISKLRLIDHLQNHVILLSWRIPLFDGATDLRGILVLNSGEGNCPASLRGFFSLTEQQPARILRLAHSFGQRYILTS